MIEVIIHTIGSTDVTMTSGGIIETIALGVSPVLDVSILAGPPGIKGDTGDFSSAADPGDLILYFQNGLT